MTKTIEYTNKEAQEFWSTLRKRVNAYFKENQIKKTANWWYYAKAGAMGLLLWGPFVAFMAWEVPVWAYLILWVIMGLGMAGVGMNVMNDANHESVSKNKLVNQVNLF